MTSARFATRRFVAVVLGIVLAGCGGGDGGDASDTTPAAPPSVPVERDEPYELDGCALLTAEEASALFGAEVDGGEAVIADPRVIGSCRWRVVGSDDDPDPLEGTLEQPLVWVTVSTDTDLVGIVPPEEMAPLEVGDEGVYWGHQRTARFVQDGVRVEIWVDDGVPRGFGDEARDEAIRNAAATASERLETAAR